MSGMEEGKTPLRKEIHYLVHLDVIERTRSLEAARSTPAPLDNDVNPQDEGETPSLEGTKRFAQGGLYQEGIILSSINSRIVEVILGGDDLSLP